MLQKNVVVTGAGSGIGKAISQYFSKNDYHVFLLGRNLEKLEQTGKDLAGDYTAIGCDLSEVRQVHKAAESIVSSGAKIHSLVNNAGIYSSKAIDHSDWAHWNSEFATNLFGPVELTRLLVPHFDHGASITNISSTLGLKTVAGTSSYSASKAAMIRWSESLAIELSSKGIRCNCICPGIIDTPIHPFHESSDPDHQAFRESLAKAHPLKRLGQAREIAEATYFLTEKSHWTTGSVLKIDGGLNLN